MMPKKGHKAIATGLIQVRRLGLWKDRLLGVSEFMGIKLKDAVIDLIDDTETKRLKLVRITSKIDGATLTMELPEALCERLSVKEHVDVTLDSKPIPKGEEAKLYAEGTLLRVVEGKALEIMGSIGGLRVELKVTKPTPSQSKTFASSIFYLMIL
jgi:hypothetical protein